ncbi:translocation/assembly module TamB [Pedobacter sp. BS3]|uniref:translocation/assembly module TamB domain-containing protein n=1 Tax=Pedobacter sp. BS3 TaxID=2567937 RepID=UPI0011EC6330|nr:translocation/assembly module TamB domain-containing protein [Pedobacter sp. BS3]TZF81842.1 translocation/assembly module TamB [Pedobacter sp. BS3]
MAALVFSLQFKPVQTYIAQKAANYLSKELHTRIDIKSLYLKPFKSLVLEDVFIEDQQKDTLLRAPRLTVDLNLLSLRLRKISVNTIQLDSTEFYLKDYKDNSTNLDFIIDYFSNPQAKPVVKKKTKPYDITFDKIVLNNFRFRYRNFKARDTVFRHLINFDDIDLRQLNATILDLNTKDHLAQFQVRHMTFKEKSGFYLKNLTAQTTLDSNGMEFKNLLLETPQTRLADYVKFKFNSYKDFNHFVDNIYMKVHFNDAFLHPQDITFFTPEVADLTLDMSINGNVTGYVNKLKARNFSVRAGQATYLKGNFDITGLPRISETFMDLQFEQIQTNKKDAGFIVSRLTGEQEQVIPDIINKFGTVNFNGRFTGFPKDFIAYGEFKTALGRVVSDVNMKIGKVPVYLGVIKAYDFDLGMLVDENMLGRTTLTASVKGSGFSVKQLKEDIDGQVKYLDFNGYRYNNIALNGTFNKNLFDGKIKINDANMKLDFAGSVNLNPKLPAFDFKASLRNANLHKLNFTNDTLQVDADFTTNFTGDDLNNIQGNLLLSQVRLTNTQTSLVVDSVSLTANNIGADRTLTVNSDILDASIHGEYDLNTLPSYFKSVVKRYIPSLKTTIVSGGTQNFDFNLNLKYFEPVSILFAPHVKVPEGAVMNGKFVSAQNIATFNAYFKLIQYDNIKVNNLIVDENNTDKAMNIFVTSDRVDFTDSLYIKNVNIANILQRDSLQFNVKLSDLDATNQLDLNGILEFGVDTLTRMSILPSDVTINHEDWRIQEKANIGIKGDKIFVDGFELFRDNQVLSINGIISDASEDHLKLTFDKFKLATFNSLTRGWGVELKGTLNGDVDVAALTKTPQITSDMQADSIVFNDTFIGDMSVKAGFDNEKKLVNANINIKKQGIETLNISGTYNAKDEDNSLDMQVKLDNSDLILFEPLLKNLVSNLKGTVSADLTLQGNVTDPKVDGVLLMNNAGMTVNYLKTPYHINDKVTVENSVIHLDNLIIKDPDNHEAIANGTVNMHNIDNPDINVQITARKFLALNTTSKDNSLYYGTAYATGVFSFNGPTDNMKINIDAKTEEGTVFNIPLNSAETVSDNEFITFVAKDSSLTAPKKNAFNGLTMNFVLNVDDNSEVNLFTDMGKLSGRGNAVLNLNITSYGDFNMFGDYLLSKGKFEFTTAQDFINKVFDISRGGSIRWTGNPTEAQINLKATYSVRTSLRPLYIAAGRPPVDQRVMTEAVMNLSGALLHPDITFGVDFPADAYVKDELQSYFSDVSNVNQQALSLIVRRSFAPGTGTDLTQQLNSTVQNAATELFFNQFNNVLAQSLNLNFVDFNIRSFNEASASIRLLNDRLVLTGGVTDTRGELNDFNVIGNSVQHDVEASYLLRKDGSLALRASNRLNNRNFLNPNEEYVSAIGLVYRQDFNNFREFLRQLVGQKRREERRQQQEQAKPKPAAQK